jgi:hypothetical protein
MATNPRQVKPEKNNGQSTNIISLISQPDECPICHFKLNPLYRMTAFLETENQVETIFQCTNEDCQHLFIARYDKNTNDGYYYFKRSSPTMPKKSNYSKEIKEISPTFCEIMDQVSYAEINNLTLITGIGLRKAIEFLVKDFLIFNYPGKSEIIKNTYLGKCIDEYIDDINLKACIKRATWLANDETHYIRKWEEHDIDDLKILIRLSINWIENVLLTKKYMKEMNE